VQLQVQDLVQENPRNLLIIRLGARSAIKYAEKDWQTFSAFSLAVLLFCAIFALGV
jgi:hypothetical protein